MVDGLVIKQLGVDDGLDNLLNELGAQVLGRDLLGVLGRDDDGVDAKGLDGT